MIATVAPVAPITDRTGAELLWAGSDYGTGVRVLDTADGAVVVREGKGDQLVVDLFDARFGMTGVFMGVAGGTVVAHLGVPTPDRGPVTTTLPGVAGYQTWDSVEQALVALAFHFVS